MVLLCYTFSIIGLFSLFADSPYGGNKVALWDVGIIYKGAGKYSRMEYTAGNGL